MAQTAFKKYFFVVLFVTKESGTIVQLISSRQSNSFEVTSFLIHRIKGVICLEKQGLFALDGNQSKGVFPVKTYSFLHNHMDKIKVVVADENHLCLFFKLLQRMEQVTLMDYEFFWAGFDSLLYSLCV